MHSNAAPQFSATPAFDLSSMRASLPLNAAPQLNQAPAAAWAADFLQNQSLQAPVMTQQSHQGQMNMDIQIDTQLQNASAGLSPTGKYFSFLSGTNAN